MKTSSHSRNGTASQVAEISGELLLSLRSAPSSVYDEPNDVRREPRGSATRFKPLSLFFYVEIGFRPTQFQGLQCLDEELLDR